MLPETLTPALPGHYLFPTEQLPDLMAKAFASGAKPEQLLIGNYTWGPWEGHTMFWDKRTNAHVIPKGMEEGYRVEDYKIYNNVLGLAALIDPWTGVMQAMPRDCYQCGRGCNEPGEFMEALKTLSSAFKNITRQTQCFFKCKQHFKDKCLPVDTMKANCMRHCQLGLGAKLGYMFLTADDGNVNPQFQCYEA